MPLLPPEPFLYPHDLFTEPQATSTGTWWAVHTRPRAEKALARKLLAAEVGFFLPLYHKRWQNQGRRHSSHLPLFPGYLFLHGDDNARVEALKSNQVAQLLPVPDAPRLQANLANVFRVMGGGLPLVPEEQLQPGSPVRIVSGPLEGLEGTVLHRGRRLHFVVEVRFLQQGVSVEIEAHQIQPLGRCLA